MGNLIITVVLQGISGTKIPEFLCTEVEVTEILIHTCVSLCYRV